MLGWELLCSFLEFMVNKGSFLVVPFSIEVDGHAILHPKTIPLGCV